MPRKGKLFIGSVLFCALSLGFAGCGQQGDVAERIMTLEAEEIGAAEQIGVPERSGYGQPQPREGTDPDIAQTAGPDGANGPDGAASDLTSDAEPAKSAASEPVSAYTIVYAGDVCLHGGVENAYRTAGVDGIIGEQLLQELTGADYTVINHEFCFSTGGVKQDKTYTFRADPANVSLLQEMGADLASLANNHALDYGTEALSDTFVTLDNAGIAYMGAGETMERAAEMITVEVNGYTLGFMAASRVYPSAQWSVQNRQPGMLSAYDPDYLAKLVAERAPQCDYLMIYLHWGIEKAEHPESYERSLAQKLIDSGADAVIGSHPHVLQGVEYYRDKPIFYSLGNFVFNASISRTAFLRATIDMESASAEGAQDLADYVTWQMIPCKASGYCTEEVTDPKAIQSFYEYIRSISYDVDLDPETGRVSNR